MRRDAVIEALHRQRLTLVERFGVDTLRLIGSTARDEATPDSDIDLIVTFDRPTGYFGLVQLQHYLEALLASPVDLATDGSLSPAMRSRVEPEAVRVT